MLADEIGDRWRIGVIEFDQIQTRLICHQIEVAESFQEDNLGLKPCSVGCGGNETAPAPAPTAGILAINQLRVEALSYFYGPIFIGVDSVNRETGPV